MMTIRRAGDIIAGTINGKPFNANFSEKVYKDLQELDKANATEDEVFAYVKTSYKILVAGSNKYVTYNPVTQEYFLVFDGETSKHPIPKSFVDYMEESFDKKVDFLPIIKAWARVLNNPRYTKEMGDYFDTYLATKYTDKEAVAKLVEEEGFTEEAATALCTYQDIAITQEGLLATYKVADMVTEKHEAVWNEETKEYDIVISPRYRVTKPEIDDTTGEVLKESEMVKPEFLEDFLFTPAIHRNGDKFFSGDKLGYIYQVGKMQHLPKDAKRNLKNTFGGGGLYAGGLLYVDGYRGLGSHVLTCFINPSDILSFQDSGNAFRTDAIFPNNVWNESDSKLKGIYHSSEYAKVSAERVDALIKDAIARDTTILEEQSKEEQSTEDE